MRIAYNVPLQVKNGDGSFVINNKIGEILKQFNIENYLSFFDNEYVDGAKVYILSKIDQKIRLFSFDCVFSNLFIRDYSIYYIRLDEISNICISHTHKQAVSECTEINISFKKFDKIKLNAILGDFDINRDKILQYIENLI